MLSEVCTYIHTYVHAYVSVHAPVHIGICVVLAYVYEVCVSTYACNVHMYTRLCRRACVCV